MAGKRFYLLFLVFCVVLSAGFIMPQTALSFTAPQVPDPTIEISPLVESVGGSFSIHYDHTYPVYDYVFSLSNTAHTFNFSRSGFGPNQVIPDPIYWNGHTLDEPNPPSWSIVPAGDYNLSLSITYWTGTDVAISQVRQVVHVRPAVSLHPVLFIHGVSSYPDMWQDAAHHNDYFSLLEAEGYPKEFLDSYHYTGVGVGENGYNNQGDIVEMAMGMDAAVNRLSEVSREYGGDGTVDIVCHSMGGLIARQYLLTHPTDHHIGKVISIGTPYQGSWLMEEESKTGNARTITDIAATKIVSLLNIDLDPRYESERQMIPGSNLLNNLNDVPASSSIEYDTLYGSIQMNISFSVFGLVIHRPISIGDGVVLESSASTVSSNQVSTPYMFKSEQPIDLGLSMVPSGTGYNIDIDPQPVNRELLGYFHTMLPTQPGVQDRVLQLLKRGL